MLPVAGMVLKEKVERSSVDGAERKFRAKKEHSEDADSECGLAWPVWLRG